MTRYFDPLGPRVLAHRGLATGAPENTLLAFAHALRAGAVYLELDVHASSDGVAIVSHDPDLRRLTGQSRTIAAMSLSALRAIDLGHGQSYSTLSEVLTAFPTARFNIDIKAQAAVASVVAAIEQAQAVDRVLITSFSERRRSATVRQLPGVATSASSIIFVFAVVCAKARLRPLLRLTLRGVHAVQIPQSAGGIRLATRRMIDEFHRAGVEVHIWTINERATMERLLDLGIDGLVTDRADVAVRLVDERSLSHRP